MNKPVEPDSSSDAHDLDALFKAQTLSAPSDLDDLILAQARDAVELTSNTEQPSAGIPYRSWFAVAAVVMIGIGIIPSLLRSPASSLEPSSLGTTTVIDSASLTSSSKQESTSLASSSAQDSAPMTSSSTPQSAPLAPALLEQAPTTQVTQPDAFDTALSVQADQATQSEEVAGGAAGDAPLENSAISSLDNSAEVATSQSQNSKLAVHKVTTKASENRTLEYRKTPESWLKEIKRLEDRNLSDFAFREYFLFRQQHPKFEKSYVPKARAIDTD